jgi:hypothetical protein
MVTMQGAKIVADVIAIPYLRQALTLRHLKRNEAPWNSNTIHRRQLVAMTKKYIDKSEVRRSISGGLQAGKSKSQILSELEDIYYGKDQLMKLVVSAIHPDIKKKFKLQNTLLGILGIALVLFRFWAFKIDYAGSGLSILTLVMAISVFSYEPVSYRFIAIISMITFLRYVSSYQFNSYLAIDLVMSAGIVGLGFYLGSRLFSNYGIFGPKKDDNGNPVID